MKIKQIESKALIYTFFVVVTFLFYSCKSTFNEDSILGNWYSLDTNDNSYREFYINDTCFTVYTSYFDDARLYKYTFNKDTLILFYECGGVYDKYLIDWSKSNKKEISIRILRNDYLFKLNKLRTKVDFYNIDYWGNDSINNEYTAKFKLRYLNELP